MLALIAPILVVIGLMMADGCGGGGGGSSSAVAARPPTLKGYAVIGFNTAQFQNPGAPAYKNVFLNVVSVRMNPSTNADVSEFDPHWVTINVPQATGANLASGFINTGLGYGGLFFGATTEAVIGQARAELQIDMTALQNVAQVFNVQPVTTNTYYQFEVILDPLAPGNVVPTCSGVYGEGCITYPAVLDPSLPSRILKFSLPAGYQVAKQLLSPAILSLNISVGPPPLGSTGAVTILPAINNVITANGNSLPPTALAGTLSGTVEYPTGKNTFSARLRPVTITAEVSGTNQIVESAPLPASCDGKTSCGFNLFLPAADTIGTLYDIYAASKSASYAVSSGQLVVSGQANTNLVSTPLQITTQTSAPFSGKVTDECAAGTAIPAATLQILVPETSGTDCSVIPTPDGCVSVATASTDEAGLFPMPGNGFTQAPFNQIPVAKGATLIVNAAGFSPFAAPLVPTTSNFKCPGVNQAQVCTLSLAHGTLQGTINVQIPPNASPTLPQVNVLVMAEDSGTNNIENVQMVTIPAGANSTTQIPFSMNVPLNTTAPAAALDVFAAAQDVFNGVPQTTTGHTYGVASAIQNSASACGDPAIVVSNPLTIECVGHGSLLGGVSGVGADTSLILSKEDPNKAGNYVAVQTTNIAPPPSSTSGSYAICAPPDAYQLTAYNSGAAGTPVPATVSTPVAVSPSPTPCPQVCDSGQGSTCLICNGTQGPNVGAP